MIIHNDIRNRVIEILKSELSEITNFYNGRLVTLDPSEQCPAIAVFLSDIEVNPITNCNNEYSAVLNVAIYHAPFNGESELDHTAEYANLAILDADLSMLNDINLKSYSYDYDTEQAAWIAATIRYEITYQD